MTLRSTKSGFTREAAAPPTSQTPAATVMNADSELKATYSRTTLLRNRVSLSGCWPGCLPPRRTRAAPPVRHAPLSPVLGPVLSPVLSPVVTAPMMTFIDVGNAVMAKVKTLLPLGPSNQLFSNLDPEFLGRAHLAGTLISSAFSTVFPPFWGVSDGVLGAYTDTHPLVSHTEFDVPGTHDPNLLKLAVAGGTGGCDSYASLTALLAAQALHAQGASFEILVVGMGDETDDSYTQKGLNAPHMVAVVRPIGDHHNAQAVVLDSWVQNSAAKPLAHTLYGENNSIQWESARIKIKSERRGRGAQMQLKDPLSGGYFNVNFLNQPQEVDYRAVQGTLSLASLNSHIENSSQQEAFSAEWAQHAAEIQSLYADGGSTLAHAEAHQLKRQTFQTEHNAAPGAPTVYRTPSASRISEVRTSTFPGHAGQPVARHLQAAADQHLMTVAAQRPSTTMEHTP
jgi:hypothetical protein